MRIVLAILVLFAAQAMPALGADAEQPKFDAVQPPEGDVNTPPKDADRQTPGGAQTAPMPANAQPVAPQISDPNQAGGNDGVKQAPAQPASPEGGGAQPQSAAPNAGPPAAPQ